MSNEMNIWLYQRGRKIHGCVYRPPLTRKIKYISDILEYRSLLRSSEFAQPSFLFYPPPRVQPEAPIYVRGAVWNEKESGLVRISRFAVVQLQLANPRWRLLPYALWPSGLTNSDKNFLCTPFHACTISLPRLSCHFSHVDIAYRKNYRRCHTLTDGHTGSSKPNDTKLQINI